MALPQTATRKYLGFEWKNCKNINSTNSNALRTFSMPTAQSECGDRFSFGYQVAGLVSECGLEIANRMYDGSREGVANNRYAWTGRKNISLEHLISSFIADVSCIFPCRTRVV
jgi:hypothetical protein